MAEATLDVATRPATDAANGMADNASAPATSAHIDYLLHLADNALVLGQRNAEWCGHGPVLEEDIAMANISVDLIGQARLLYQHVAVLTADGATEDSLAYWRDAPDFRNFTLLELPHSAAGSGDAAGARDYAVTIVRNFLYSALMVLRWDALQQSTDAQLAAIAERSLKEARYHLRHSRDWLVRLGDGTSESHAKTQAACDYLMPFTLEFWTESAIENEVSAQGIGVATDGLRADWQALVQAAAADATLNLQAAISLRIALPQGKHGIHSRHLEPLLAELQSLARQHPGATW